MKMRSAVSFMILVSFMLFLFLCLFYFKQRKCLRFYDTIKSLLPDKVLNLSCITAGSLTITGLYHVDKRQTGPSQSHTQKVIILI